MVLRTPTWNLPYVQDTDTPISYPTTSQELATTLDALGAQGTLQSTSIHSPWKIKLGTFMLTGGNEQAPTANASGRAHITFAYPFPVACLGAMVVQGDIGTATPTAWYLSVVSSWTKTGFDYDVRRYTDATLWANVITRPFYFAWGY